MAVVVVILAVVISVVVVVVGSTGILIIYHISRKNLLNVSLFCFSSKSCRRLSSFCARKQDGVTFGKTQVDDKIFKFPLQQPFQVDRNHGLLSPKELNYR